MTGWRALEHEQTIGRGERLARGDGGALQGRLDGPETRSPRGEIDRDHLAARGLQRAGTLPAARLPVNGETRPREARKSRSVAAVAVVRLQRQMLQQALLRLPHGDRAEHLLGLLRQRNRRHDAGQLGHGEAVDRGLHLVEHRTGQLLRVDRPGELEGLVEAIGEAGARLVALRRASP